MPNWWLNSPVVSMLTCQPRGQNLEFLPRQNNNFQNILHLCPLVNSTINYKYNQLKTVDMRIRQQGTGTVSLYVPPQSPQAENTNPLTLHILSYISSGWVNRAGHLLLQINCSSGMMMKLIILLLSLPSTNMWKLNT